MYKNRREAVRRMSPYTAGSYKNPGWIHYQNDFGLWKIRGIPNRFENETRIKNYNKLNLSFFCPDPFWQSLIDRVHIMGYTGGGFSFPFSFDSTVSFGGFRREMVITTQSDVPAPLLISINGPAQNPELRNASTGQTLKFNLSLAEGERLDIDTTRGIKSLNLYRLSRLEPFDGYQYMDLSSSFWSLLPGANLIRYSSGADELQTVIEIKYNERYLGV